MGAALAVAALLTIAAATQASTFSIRVFNADGTQVTTEAVNLSIRDSANNLLTSQTTQSGTFTVIVSSKQTADVSLTFSFNRGNTTVSIGGINAQAASPPTRTMDVVITK